MRLLFPIYICLLIHSIISKIEYDQLKSDEKQEDNWLEIGEEFTINQIILNKNYEFYFNVKGKKNILEIEIPPLEHEIEAGFCSFNQKSDSAFFECITTSKDLVLEEKDEGDKYIITSSFELEKDYKYMVIFIRIKKEINYLTLKVEESEGISGLLIAIIVLIIFLFLLIIAYFALKSLGKKYQKNQNKDNIKIINNN